MCYYHPPGKTGGFHGVGCFGGVCGVFGLVWRLAKIVVDFWRPWPIQIFTTVLYGDLDKMNDDDNKSGYLFDVGGGERRAMTAEVVDDEEGQ